MEKNFKKIMQEEIAKLSTNKQEAINSIDWETITREIGKKNLLEEEEIDRLQKETGLFLLGITDGDTYKFRLEDFLVSIKTTEDITNEMLEKIFLPITTKMEVSIKNEMATKKPKWDQTVRFIISGGDYSVFLNH